MPRVPDEYLQARSRQILRAAARCFARHGVSRTSMAEVAEEAELSVGALYRYFDGKDELVRALAEAGRELNRSVRREAASHGAPEEKLLALVRRYLELLADPETRGTVALSVRLWAEALENEVVGEELRRSYREQLTGIEELLREARAGGSEGAARDAGADARAVIALLNDASLQVLIDPEMDLDRYAAAVERLVRCLFGGEAS